MTIRDTRVGADIPRDEMKPGDLGLPYEVALHGIQTAVLYEIERGISQDTTRKHLRVGVNSAMINEAATATLLIEKGIFTLEEYEEMVRYFANKELAGYEAKYPRMTFR